MNLSFATKFPARKKGLAGKPTNFIEMIWAGLNCDLDIPLNEYEKYLDKYWNKFKEHFGDTTLEKKIHTIRRDANDRWKEGNDIHFNINVRTTSQFRFAPIVKCTGTQTFEIKWTPDKENEQFKVEMFIDGKILDVYQMKDLAINDGFDSLKDFCCWFDEDFKGKIIHWTPLKYGSTNDIDVVDHKVIKHG